MIKYSIIIPTYKHLEDCLKPCLESIIKHTNLSEVEVIVVANGCGDDGTSQYVDSLKAPFRLVWLEEPSGYTHSTNIGIDIAKGEYIVLLNNDNIITGNNWLEILAKPFEDQMVGITGAAKDYHIPTQTEFLLFFCCMIPRRIFNKFGLLDEAFNPGYGEDIDYCIKLKQAGYKVVQVPNDISISDRRPITDHTIQFPLWHKGSVTVHEEPTWETVVPRNEKILIERHGNKRNIINVGDTLDTIPYSQVYNNYSRIMESLPEDGLMLARIDRRTNVRVTKSGFAHSLFTGNDGKYNLKMSDVVVDKSSFETIKEHVLSCGIKSVQFGGNWHGGYSTQQDPDEVSHFLNGIKDLKIKNYLEIGCADGGLTRLVCDVVDIQNVTHVDIGWADANTPFTYRNNLLNLRNSGVIDVFRGDSHGTQVKEFLAGKKFDFIFIDGDHSKEGVKLDTILATEHAEEGCIFAYHDIMIPEINEVMKELETGKFGKFAKVADFVNWNHPFGIGLYRYTPKADYNLTLQQQDPHVYKEIFINNDYKVLEEEVKGKTVIDIGANVGMFAIKCMELGAKKVIAIEPESNNYNKLLGNISDFPNIIPQKYAVANRNGDFVRISNEGGGSKLGLEGELVGCVKMSHIFMDISDKDVVLKMDCEGSEVDILLNLDDATLRRFSTIYIELHPPLENILKVRDRLSKQFIQSHSSQLFNYLWDTQGKLTQSGMDLFIEKWTRKPLMSAETIIVDYSPKISIVIPTYNHLEDCLKPCIESIIKHTDFENVELVVVANGCTDGTKYYLDSISSAANIKMVWIDEPVGFIKATNAGIKAATGEYIVLLNNDTEITGKDWLDTLLKPFLQDSKVGITGPYKDVRFLYQNQKTIFREEYMIFYCAALRKSMLEELAIYEEI